MRQRPWTIDAAWLTGLLLLLSLHFWFPFVPAGPPHNSFSAQPIGKQAYFELVSRLAAFDVERNRQRIARYTASATPPVSEADMSLLCILGPARQPTDQEWDTILDWVAQGGRLIYAFRSDLFWEIEADGEFMITDGETLNITVAPRPFLQQNAIEWNNIHNGLTEFTTSRSDDEPAYGMAWKSSAEIRGSANAEELLYAGDSLQAVRVPFGRGSLTVLASDWVFSNHSLSWSPNSVFAYRLLETADPQGSIVFDEFLNDTGVAQGMHLLFNVQFRHLTIQLLACTCLYGWYCSHRFGPILPPRLAMRHNIVDHTDAAGYQHYRSRDGHIVVADYMSQLTTELNLKAHPGHEEQLLEPVAVALNTTAKRILKTLHRIDQQIEHGELDRRQTLRCIRALARIRTAVAHPQGNPRSL